VRSLESHAVNQPADAGRPGRSGVERQAEIILGIKPVAGRHALQDFGAVLGTQAKGPQTGFVATVRPDQAQDAEIFFIDELRRGNQRAVHLPPFLGALRVLALANFNAELALVGRPFQDVEKLLAGAGWSGFFLGDGNRDATQVFEPGQGAAADSLLRIALFDGLEQHGGNVLAMLAGSAGAAADYRHLAALGLAQVSLCDVWLGRRTRYKRPHLAALDIQVAHQVDVRPCLVDVACGEPLGDVFFSEGGEVDDGHRRSVNQGADE